MREEEGGGGGGGAGGQGGQTGLGETTERPNLHIQKIIITLVYTTIYYSLLIITGTFQLTGGMHVSPMYEKGEHYDLVNYRPVPLTGISCKVFLGSKSRSTSLSTQQWNTFSNTLHPKTWLRGKQIL